MHLEFMAEAQLSDKDAEALEALHAAVYRPKPRVESAKQPREWALPQWHILMRDVDDQLISHVGAVTRLCLCDGKEILVGGIGGVMTQPSQRGKGYAGAGIRRAIEFLQQGLRWRGDTTGDRIPAARHAGRYGAPLLRASFAELLSTLRLQKLLCGYLCTAIRRKDIVPARRNYGHALDESLAAVRGAGFVRPTLVIAAALCL